MTEKTLAMIVPDLVQRLELRDGLSNNSDRKQVVNNFFNELEQTVEMDTGSLRPGYYTMLRELVLNEILPLYDNYAATRDSLNTRKNERKILPYIIGTVASIEVVSAILSKGETLRPQVMIPMIFAESVLGGLIFGAAQTRDNWKIDNARNQLYNNVRTLDQTLLTCEKYNEWKQTGGANNVLRADALNVVQKYNTPQAFWSDYAKARSLDPQSVHDLTTLNAPQFNNFLHDHVHGAYPAQARISRFNQLFLVATEEFTKNDPQNYVLDSLKSRPKK